MKSFNTGQRINHPLHGECTITYVGEKYIGVRFDDHRNALLTIESFFENPPLEQSGPESNSKPRTKVPENWPENTFFQDLSGAKRDKISCLTPFFDGMEEITERMHEITENCRELLGFGSFYNPPRIAPSTWVEGHYYAWPDVHQGLILSLTSQSDAWMLASLYPYYESGIEIALTLDRVTVMAEGVEARITAEWGEADITFFDTHFLINRGWYESGKPHNFILVGIAYSAVRSSVTELPFTPNPDHVAWERMLAEERGEAPPAVSDKICLNGMAVLMPMPDWDEDIYQFRGPVKSVKEVPNMLGQSGWLVRVTVMRFGDEEADLDILITRRVWEGHVPPEPGTDIEGTLWLQGRLCSCQDWENRSK